MRLVRTPLVLLVALGAAVAAHRLGSVEQVATSARQPLVAREAFDPENLAEVAIDRDGVNYRFVRRGGSWWQTKPVEHAVDGWSVRQFAARVMKAESVRSVGLAEDPSTALESAGLLPAQGRIELLEEAAGGGSPRRVVVELGRRSLAGRAYARVVEPAGSQPEYEVIDGTLHEFALERDPREFRRRDLFIDVGEIDRVELSAGESTTAIVRSGRSYRIDGPIRTRADRQQCEELFDAIRRARSEGFIVDNPVELSVYGLQPPAASLVVRSGAREIRLRIGDPVSIGAQDRFGLLEGTSTVVRIPAAVLAGIAPRADRLIDTLATGVRAADVGAIEIVEGASRLALRRETDGWQATAIDSDTSEAKGSVDASSVSRLLAALTETRAGSVQIVAFPADRAVATITLRGFAGEALDTVRVAAATNGGFALENGDGVLRIHGAIDLPLSRQDLGFAVNRTAQ
ncbi:MAG: hypothetical protein RLY21_2089 [Planctomycetota bacterium]|jgi:hypothetical protein